METTHLWQSYSMTSSVSPNLFWLYLDCDNQSDSNMVTLKVLDAERIRQICRFVVYIVSNLSFRWIEVLQRCKVRPPTSMPWSTSSWTMPFLLFHCFVLSAWHHLSISQMILRIGPSERLRLLALGLLGRHHRVPLRVTPRLDGIWLCLDLTTTVTFSFLASYLIFYLF